MFVGISFQNLAPLYVKLFMYMSLCFPLGRERPLTHITHPLAWQPLPHITHSLARQPVLHVIHFTQQPVPHNTHPLAQQPVLHIPHPLAQ